MASKNLNNAKKDKFDEFYTQLSDIEKELVHYRDHFRGKVVFCNCDDPEFSNFYFYFSQNFDNLGLKKLITTHFEKDKPSYKLEIVSDINNDGNIDGKDVVKTTLQQNGDFRSEETIALLKEADIVVTNPPFSLLREFVSQLFEYEKKFLIVANINFITCKEIFPLVKDNKMWLGYKSGAQEFEVPEEYGRDNSYKSDNKRYAKFGNICWLTNLDIKKRHEPLPLYKSYSPEEFKKYDGYDAIEVSRVSEIPFDYDGVMGVPITFLYKYNPDQFEILGLDRYMEDSPHYGKRFNLKGRETYVRVMIKHRRSF